MLQKPDRVLSLLTAQHKICCSAQVRGGYSFAKLQMLQEGHLAPEHTHINHQLCQRVRGVLKSTLPPPWCTAKGPPAFDKRSKESNGYHRQGVNSWLPASALGSTLQHSFLLQPVEEERKENQSVIPVFNDLLL